MGFQPCLFKAEDVLHIVHIIINWQYAHSVFMHDTQRL